MVVRTILASGAVALALAAGQAGAAPATSGFATSVEAPSQGMVHQVWGRRGGWGPGWFGLGLGAGIVAGAIIADESYRPRRGYYYDSYAYDGPYYYPANFHGDPREICAQNFRSFEWRSGMYTTYSGERRLCPYLR